MERRAWRTGQGLRAGVGWRAPGWGGGGERRRARPSPPRSPPPRGGGNGCGTRPHAGRWRARARQWARQRARAAERQPVRPVQLPHPPRVAVREEAAAVGGGPAVVFEKRARLAIAADGHGGQVPRRPRVHHHRPHKGDVRAEAAVVARAVEADKDAKAGRRPRRRLLATVKARLVVRLGAQPRERGLRGRGGRHGNGRHRGVSGGDRGGRRGMNG